MPFLLESSRSCKKDSKAFLFSLKNPTKNPRKLPQIGKWTYCAVFHRPRQGPTFKGLHITYHANKKRNSFEFLGDIYTVPSRKIRDLFLTGDKYFKASEMEIFYETTQ